MARSASQQRGIDFEKIVAYIIGGEVQPGSGNKFYAKNDVIANGLSISCKSQREYSWKEIKKYLNESIDNSHGTGYIPSLVIDDNSQDSIVIMKLTDLAKAFGDGIKIKNSKSSKGIKKREEIEIPLLMR